MHEMSIAESIVELVEAEARADGFTQLRAIRLRLGVLGHVAPEALRFCFEAVARGTVAEGARLEIEMIQAAGRCCGCGAHWPLQERFESCAGCGDFPMQMITGDEMRVAELEVA